jgi:hypothetical protein
MIPTLADVHPPLPVSDLDRSIERYSSRSRSEVVIEFHQHGQRAAVSMTHPDGGPILGLTLDPQPARAPADHLRGLGEAHSGVQFAMPDWILPMLHDPDAHEVRFYSMDSHTETDSTAAPIVDAAIASARAKEQP